MLLHFSWIRHLSSKEIMVKLTPIIQCGHHLYRQLLIARRINHHSLARNPTNHHIPLQSYRPLQTTCLPWCHHLSKRRQRRRRFQRRPTASHRRRNISKSPARLLSSLIPRSRFIWCVCAARPKSYSRISDRAATR